MVPRKGDRGRGHDGQHETQAGQGGERQDGQPPRPAGQVPGRWGRERRLTGVRWPEGWECERCGCATCSPVAGRNRTWQCTRCPRHLSVAAGTAMQYSKVRLLRWFHAMWLLARSKRGVSALELAAQVGVSENTATFMPGRLRGAMARSGCLRRAVGRGRGGRLLRRRARQDEEARARREPPHCAPRDLEPRVLGHRDVPRPVDGGAAVLTRTTSPGGARIAGATPPWPWSPTAAWGTTAATSCAGRPSARSPPARPGASGQGGVPINCGYEAYLIHNSISQLFL